MHIKTFRKGPTVVETSSIRAKFTFWEHSIDAKGMNATGDVCLCNEQ